MYWAMNRVSDAACRNSAMDTTVYIAQKKGMPHKQKILRPGTRLRD